MTRQGEHHLQDKEEVNYQVESYRARALELSTTRQLVCMLLLLPVAGCVWRLRPCRDIGWTS
jgi:hypothetical protein